MLLNFKKKHIPNISPVQIICLSFAVLILFGASLLCLPISSTNGQFTSFFDCLFTATSASCVTGLTVCDTFNTWSIFGRSIILVMIQLGGLGVVTFTTIFTMSLRGKLGLRDLRIASEQISISNLSDVQSLLKSIIKVTFTCEAIGAILLCIPFCTRFSFNGIFVAIFTSISAYCNAGFDVVGFIYPDCNLKPFAGDPFICIVVSTLIIIGGLGFVVLHDLITSKKDHSRIHKITVHSKIVLLTTAAIIVIGTILFFTFEYNHTMKNLNVFEKLNTSFLTTATARTAGFSMIDYSEASWYSIILSIFLMFVGASPGSTGGGIKTTTMVILIMTMICVLKSKDDTIIFKRKISKHTVYKALALVTLALLILFIAIIIMWINDPQQKLLFLTFEAVSAFSTTGLSALGTSNLSTVSKSILILLMYIGRVGPASFILIFGSKPESSNHLAFPEGKIFVG